MNTNKNVSESKRVGKAVRAKKQQCYMNAVRVIWKVPEYNNATYVEGYAVTGRQLLHRTWLGGTGRRGDRSDLAR